MSEEVSMRDAQMRKEGMKYRTTAFVHPKSGGDDYIVDIYTEHPPTKEEIHKHLKQRNSAIFDDYEVYPL